MRGKPISPNLIFTREEGLRKAGKGGCFGGDF
jgi:hypothetical protein